MLGLYARSAPDWIETEFARAGNLSVGCGFITWALAQREAQDPGLLAAVLARKPRAVLFSFGDCTAFAEQARAADVPVFAQVQTLADAHAALAAGAEVIVASKAARPVATARPAEL